jgi:hypothetical protein
VEGFKVLAHSTTCAMRSMYASMLVLVLVLVLVLAAHR